MIGDAINRVFTQNPVFFPLSSFLQDLNIKQIHAKIDKRSAKNFIMMNVKTRFIASLYLANL